MKIAFLGDISLNDTYIKMYKEGHNPFTQVYNELYKLDFVVGNLENTCQGDKVSDKPLPKLFTTCDTLNYLNYIPVNLVTLANNHIGDNYEKGFDKTVNKLNELNIRYFGAGHNKSQIENPINIDKDNLKIGFFNYYGKDFDKSVPKDSKINVNKYEKDKIIDDIEKNKNNFDHIVLLFHWGARVEGSYLPDYYMFKDAKDFIAAGCSLILGHHSHTFQPYESLHGKFIFYSLGNFSFSNYYHEGQLRYIDKKRSLKSGIPILNFTKDSIKLDKILYIKNNTSEIIISKKEPIIYKINNLKLPLIKIKIFWKLNYIYHKRFDWIFKLFFRSSKPKNLLIKEMINIKLIKKGFLKIIGKI